MLYVITPAESYKAKRLRRNPEAMVAPCSARGAPRGDAMPAQVEFLPPDEYPRIDRLMKERYRVRGAVITPIDEHGGAYLAISSRA